ncbi:tetratricopeptide repeat protein [Methylobacterium currus]|nr:tetratricopeptide repeat protein [Methylobacterium currus]
MHRRNDWYDAYKSLSSALEIFPDSVDICYWAALNAIDAGSYESASGLLDRLGDRLSSIPERYLRGIWRAAGVVGNIQLASAAFSQAKAQGSELALDAVGLRIESALAAQSINLCPIISVGENCQPWMLPNRWGLRRPSDIGPQSSMFNLGQSNCYGVAKILRSLGENFVSPEYLSVKEYPQRAPCPTNDTFHYEFNHELGKYWLENNYENLISRYKSRISNFHKFIAGQQRVFFFYSDRDGDINSVVDAIIEINQDDNYSIVIIDLFDGERPSRLRHHDRVSYARLRFPDKDYVWWRPDHHDSDAGVYFERSIRNQLIDAARI